MRIELNAATPLPAQQSERDDRSGGLGMAFRQMRVMQGFTQQQAADRAKIDRATLSQIENGHSSLMIGTIVAIANALDLKIEVRLLPRGGKR